MECLMFHMWNRFSERYPVHTHRRTNTLYKYRIQIFDRTLKTFFGFRNTSNIARRPSCPDIVYVCLLTINKANIITHILLRPDDSFLYILDLSIFGNKYAKKYLPISTDVLYLYGLSYLETPLGSCEHLAADVNPK